MEWRERAGTIFKREVLTGLMANMFKRKAVSNVSRKMQGGITATNKSVATTAKPVDYEILIAEKGDTIEDIADFAGIKPSVIIKLNNLKAPYRLKNGQEIRVPKSKRRT
jgi:LysM repeat protein